MLSKVLEGLLQFSRGFKMEFLNYPLFKLGGQTITPVQVAQLLAFVLTLILSVYVARVVRILFEKRLLHRAEPGLRYTFARLTQYMTWMLGLLIALKIINIDLTALAVVAGALGIGIGFGLQNLVSNFVAGLVLLFERPIKVSDRISVENVEGNVIDINFRSTTIVTNDNIAIIVPNSQFVNQTVINWSHGAPWVRIKVPVGVAYGSELQLVTDTLLEVAAQTEGVLRDPEPAVRFSEFGDSSLLFELLVWTADADRHRGLRSRINYAIDAAFREKQIEVPYPQRVVRLINDARRGRENEAETDPGSA